MSDVEIEEIFVIDEISGRSRMLIETSKPTVARICFTWDSDYEFERFDDAAVQPDNSYYKQKYDPVPENINECMYEEENFWQHEKKHKKYASRNFKRGIVNI